jgi:two-component system nitrogen regulation response regulator NtrX
MEREYDILVVDDEASIRHLLSGILEDEGYRVGSVGTSGAAFEFFSQHAPKVAILDVWLERSDDGLVMLEGLRRKYPESTFLMMSGHGTIDIAVKAIKLGARDFVTKPFRSDMLLHTIGRLMEERRLRHENVELRRKYEGDGWLMLQGESKVVKRLRREVGLASGTLSHVVLEGELGSGKTSMGRYLHSERPREGRFVVLNCDTPEGETLFRRYFGSDMGDGVYEELRGSTLLVEDVDRFSLLRQKEFLEGLLAHRKDCWEEGEQYRLVVTSRRKLKLLVEEGLFDESLYYRLAIMTLSMPSLRDRRSDMEILCHEMMKSCAVQLGRRPRVVTGEALSLMRGLGWGGNFHQLRNIVERLLLVEGDVLPVEASEMSGLLAEEDRGVGKGGGDVPLSVLFEDKLREAKLRFEGMYLSYHLENCDGNVSRLSEVSGMERTALHRKLRFLGVRGE